MSNPDPTMSIIIVNYNTREHLVRCLESLSPRSHYEVIVVDNGSTDGSVEWVREVRSDVVLVLPEGNMGYGGGANAGIAVSRAPYVLLLNSDTIVSPSVVEALTTYLDTNPRIAVVGPRLRNADGSLQPSCYPFPTPLHIFLEESTLGRWIRYVPFLKERYWRTWSHDRAQSVPWVLGAALAMRRTALNEVGGFDPTFFMYYEEVDLCFRITQKGWKIHFVPVADIIHVGGMSTAQAHAAMLQRLFQSLTLFYQKHYSPIQLVLLQVVIAIVLFFRIVRETILITIYTIDHNNKNTTQLSVLRHTWLKILNATVRGKYATG